MHLPTIADRSGLRNLRRMVFATGFVAAGMSCAAASAVPPQLAQAQGAGADVAQNLPKYQGSGDCSKCHVKPTEDEVADGTTRYFEMTEVSTWAEKDKHALAYLVLKNSRSQRMGQLLGIKPESDASCVGCHSVNVDAGQCAEGSPIRVQQKGVGCEACHGPASNWIDDHWHPNKWRNKLTQKEKAEKGFIDLRDDVKRAEGCLSCHIGDAQQNKVVTHDMFAAGHPPISGFEIETFARAMPKHWKPGHHQPPSLLDQNADRSALSKPEAMYSTRMMTIGGLVAMKFYARLIHGNAAARAQVQAAARFTGSRQRRPIENVVARPEEKTEAPLAAIGPPSSKGPLGASGTELAFYDCQACHHELTVDSWRQKRGYPGRPGRPTVRAWPIALGKIAAGACGDHRAALLAALEKLYAAIDKQPFGAPEEVVTAADRLAERADEAIAFIKTERFDAVNGLALFQEICSAGSTDLPDFETARQLGWTSRVVYDELPKEYHSKELDELLDALRTDLSLAIPSRTEEISQGSATEPDECTCVANKSVPQTLAAAAKYDPRLIQARFQKLAKLLGSMRK